MIAIWMVLIMIIITMAVVIIMMEIMTIIDSKISMLSRIIINIRNVF